MGISIYPLLPSIKGFIKKKKRLLTPIKRTALKPIPRQTSPPSHLLGIALANGGNPLQFGSAESNNYSLVQPKAIKLLVLLGRTVACLTSKEPLYMSY